VLQWVKDSNLNLVTVDFSLNSPGICIWQSSTNRYHFISYLKPGTGTKAEQRRQEEIDTFSDVSLIDQPDWKASLGDYSKNEFAKIIRYKTTADHLIRLITGITQTKEDYYIAFEGSSYGSKMGTNNIIDMAAGAAILKEQMISKLDVRKLLTVAPTTIKKHAGKGNMNKAALWTAFLNNVCESPELAKSPLYKYCVSEIGEVKKVPKPFDDLVDAWFLNHYLLSQLGENLPD
tara:strand:- start:559 stop:1257 length:699 start_codon:yes stop_codon:yes gene_type:complete